ncbi:tRNA pseudouridine(38-40) synthase TruA [Kiritimatiella glycovorans]|uniref:tRNA pseudouridine synthase A n=1 Tax=Kiritimatiella glycovorans TaxID=1307763 RepID=A0A0G3EHS5_9BACT|nr:tRNA pseudouridine(38-40) synthase TruA [Kiritimatiella glycovorans]AKJ64350.1 tRNA pseudouridine synthase A [Kiritimatiella glycovorans]
MTRYHMIIAYDGTAYYGWQVQPHHRTVQQTLEDALERLFGARPRVHASGRTDTGVHARGQSVHFDAPRTMEAADIRNALNAFLPPDVRVMKTRRVPSGFHARYDATGKEYRYFIWDGPVLPPHRRHTHHHVPRRLDVEAMEQGAAALIGRHDFTAFAAWPKKTVENPVRTIDSLRIRRHGHETTIAVRGDGFLYKMVRSLAGYLIRIGTGERRPDDVKPVLESAERTAEVPTAPGHGLVLWRVTYGTTSGIRRIPLPRASPEG